MQSRTGACYPGRPVGDVMAITKGAFRCRTDTVRVGLTRQRRSVLEFGYGPLALIQASGDAGSRRNHRRGPATYDRSVPVLLVLSLAEWLLKRFSNIHRKRT
jgi:hypothetical protein